MQMPAVDQVVCGSWNEQQVDLYNKMPFFMMEAQADYRKHWTVYDKLLNSVPWKPNMGDTMRRVMSEPTPVGRQEAYPQVLANNPKTDVITYFERKTDAKIRWQDFISPHFSFLPEFQDFLKHIKENQTNIDRQITIFEDIFYRTMLFHWAPYVYIVGYGLVEAPVGDPSADGSTGKTTAFLQDCIAKLSASGPGYLTFEELFKALNAFEQEVGATPFEGTGKPGGDSAPLNEKYCLVQSPESWNNFVSDPWVKENRPLSMDIVTGPFKGDLFGRIRSKMERFPLRYAITDDYVPSQKVPEVTELNPNRPDFNRTKPNPLYARPSNSPIEVGALMGGNCADYIKVGPPPSEFVRNMDQGAATSMTWNGQSYATKDFLVPCKDDDGNTQIEANSFGRYMRIQASLSLGISLVNMQNFMPIIFKRRVGITSAINS